MDWTAQKAQSHIFRGFQAMYMKQLRQYTASWQSLIEEMWMNGPDM